MRSIVTTLSVTLDKPLFDALNKARDEHYKKVPWTVMLRDILTEGLKTMDIVPEETEEKE